MHCSRSFLPTWLVSRWRFSACRAVALAAAFGLATPAAALLDDRPPPTPTPPPAAEMADAESTRPGRAPLLREGSQIQNVRGTLRHHQVTGTWRFTIAPETSAADDAPRHEFIMLPNTHLGEMQQVIASMPDRIVSFQITGEVFVYSGRNYLLVSFPPRVISEHASARRATREAEGEVEESKTRGRSAADIMSDLERETGPVGRALAAPRDRGRPRERQDRAEIGVTWPENASVQLRRGRIGRDAGGAWQFIFDADASGQADPPMTLMPCLLLERIERYARQAGSNAPVLISGRVFTHGGRNYLLPTVFQIPRERTELMP